MLPPFSLACGLANIQSVCRLLSARAQVHTSIADMRLGACVRQKEADVSARRAAGFWRGAPLSPNYICPNMLELEQCSPNTFNRHERQAVELLAKVISVKKRKLSMLYESEPAPEPAPTPAPAEGPREPAWPSSSVHTSCSPPPPPPPPTRRPLVAKLPPRPRRAAATRRAAAARAPAASPPLPPPPPQPTSTLTPAIPRLRSPEASPNYYIL